MRYTMTIYTIGHSNRPVADLIAMLQFFGVRLLADVRSMPGSKWNPQYNRGPLEGRLLEAGIQYAHMPGLGGKQTTTDTAIASRPLSGYAGYMATPAFKAAIAQLEQTAATTPVAYMCAEADWRHCHRRYISDHLLRQGYYVMHISDVAKAEPHTLSPPPPPRQGDLFAAP